MVVVMETESIEITCTASGSLCHVSICIQQVPGVPIAVGAGVMMTNVVVIRETESIER